MLAARFDAIALKLFGDLVKGYPTMCAGSSSGGVIAFPVKSADGAKLGLLVSDYTGKSRQIAVNVKGIPADAKVRATVLDYTRDPKKFPVALKDGVLETEKSDGNSAAGLIEFE